MKGYKGFNKGLICRGKKYEENTVFEESNAEICISGMHFCENPFDVLTYYPFVSDNAELNEFAEVESLAEAETDDEKKFCTKKLKVGKKLDIAGLCSAFVDFTLGKAVNSATNTGDCSAATNAGNRSAATNTGDYSAATNIGRRSAATNTGNCSAATNTGNRSAAITIGYRSSATVEGNESFAITTGMDSKAKGALGCYIAVAEWGKGENGEYQLKDFKAHKVDGREIKADTFYTLRDGEFVEVE